MDVAEYGSMFIQLTEKHFSSGQQINGTILLNLLKPIEGASSLTLILGGKEMVSLIETYKLYYGPRVKGQSRSFFTKRRRHNQENEICQLKFPIFQFEQGRIEPGMYHFPFSLLLTTELPSSFDATWVPPLFTDAPHNVCFARTEYALMAVVEGKDQQLLVNYVQKITINQADVAEFGTHMVEGQVQNNCCLMDRGTTRLKTYFEKNEYSPGETAHILFDLDNTASDVSAKSVTATLVQVQTFMTKHHSEQQEIELQTVTTTGVQARGSLKTQMMKLVLRDRKQQPIAPTCRGKLVHCEYQLRIKVVLDSACTSSPDQIQSALLTTVRCPDTIYPQWTPPANWQPEIMPVVQFPWSNEHKIPILPAELGLQIPIIEGEEVAEPKRADDT